MERLFELCLKHQQVQASPRKADGSTFDQQCLKVSSVLTCLGNPQNDKLRREKRHLLNIVSEWSNRDHKGRSEVICEMLLKLNMVTSKQCKTIHFDIILGLMLQMDKKLKDSQQQF